MTPPGAIRAGLVPAEQIVAYLIYRLALHKQHHGGFPRSAASPGLPQQGPGWDKEHPQSSTDQRQQARQRMHHTPKAVRKARLGASAVTAVHAAADAQLQHWRQAGILGAPPEAGCGGLDGTLAAAAMAVMPHPPVQQAPPGASPAIADSRQTQQDVSLSSCGSASTPLDSNRRHVDLHSSSARSTGLPAWDEGSVLDAVIDVLLGRLGVDRWGTHPSQREAAFEKVLTTFRSGQLGKMTLDILD